MACKELRVGWWQPVYVRFLNMKVEYAIGGYELNPCLWVGLPPLAANFDGAVW